MSEPLDVLFVDDELVPGQDAPNGNYMWYYARALRDAGFNVTEVGTTDEAFGQLTGDTKPYRLILLDVLLPPGQQLAEEDTQQGTRTGLILAQRFRRLFADPLIPIVVFTQYRRLANDHAFKIIPACHVLLKDDFTPIKLADELRRILGT